MAGETTNYDLIKPAYEDTADIADINTNMDSIDTLLAARKTKQTAKTDPTASGTSATFIATITQNANGEITATKKTVRTMTGATSDAAGATGLVPAPGTADAGRFLKGNGQWAVPTNTTYSEATSSAYGLVKIGYTTSGKNYAVKLSSGKMYVNVPWTDTNTTYNQATSSALGLVKIGYSASGKNYAVQLDNSGKMFVNVPWTDNNTTYSEATASVYGLVKIGYTTSGKNYAVQLSSGKMYVNVPWSDTTYSKATNSALGLVKIGYSTNGKNYAVALNSDGQMYVNVPWANTTYTAGTGLTLANSVFSVSKANVSTMMNLLDTWNSDAKAADYIIAQYTDGGTSNTAYYRKPANKVVNGTLVKAALGTNSSHGGAYLRKDGTWVVPPNTTYSVATTSANGLMSSSDKTKLDNLVSSAGSLFSLITNVHVNSLNNIEFTTYSSRKFSDYNDLIFVLHGDSNGKVFTDTVSIPSGLWASGKSVELLLKGSNTGVYITYNSDTKISARIVDMLSVNGGYVGTTIQGTGTQPITSADITGTGLVSSISAYIEILGRKKVS